jgi:Xaa-Pro aminopeptidase
MGVPEERLYIRVEDTVVVMENGIENLTELAPFGS